MCVYSISQWVVFSTVSFEEEDVNSFFYILLERSFSFLSFFLYVKILEGILVSMRIRLGQGTHITHCVVDRFLL